MLISALLPAILKCFCKYLNKMHSSTQNNSWHMIGTQEHFAECINKLMRKGHEITTLENIKYILRGMLISVIKILSIRELFIL